MPQERKRREGAEQLPVSRKFPGERTSNHLYRRTVVPRRMYFSTREIEFSPREIFALLGDTARVFVGTWVGFACGKCVRAERRVAHPLAGVRATPTSANGKCLPRAGGTMAAPCIIEQ